MLASLTKTFQHKIKTAEELRGILKDPPRKRKVIMCHGVFDVVHPGHLRHLLYAKEKAPILVVSITADVHITKGHHRPHIPQDLRAANLAAFEIVDYVVIDSDPTPIRNLKKIQPDYFAKGYEYNAKGPPPKTQEEIDTLQAYGGEIIFTPGDVVFSSSKFLELQPPALKIEKLQAVMEANKITFDSLRKALGQVRGKRIHVVGDTIVDSHTKTAMIGGSTKTPTMSVLFEGRKDYIGGAAIVAKHLRAAGAEVVFSTVMGSDPLKDFVVEGLKEAGIDCRPIIDETRPTNNKNSIITDGYRLLKIDTLDNRTINDDIVKKLVGSIEETRTDAVAFCDFRHGIFNRRTIPRLVTAIPKKVYRIADSQVASRWGNITEFKGFDLITPNEHEARFALADQDSGIRPLASALYDAAECKTLIMKMGSRGVLTCVSAEHEEPDSFFSLDSFVDRVVDAVGAGDALLSYAALSMLATGCPATATILGSMAAACECERDGNIPITPEFLNEKINVVERQARYE